MLRWNSYFRALLRAVFVRLRWWFCWRDCFTHWYCFNDAAIIVDYIIFVYWLLFRTPLPRLSTAAGMPLALMQYNGQRSPPRSIASCQRRQQASLGHNTDFLCIMLARYHSLVPSYCRRRDCRGFSTKLFVDLALFFEISPWDGFNVCKMAYFSLQKNTTASQASHFRRHSFALFMAWYFHFILSVPGYKAAGEGSIITWHYLTYLMQVRASYFLLIQVIVIYAELLHALFSGWVE